MGTPYTSGVWHVKPGEAEAFVAAWREFAEWSKENFPGAGWAKLLRDQQDENRFVTFGPWESMDVISAWRSHPGWQERAAKMREHLVGFEPSTLELVLDFE